MRFQISVITPANGGLLSTVREDPSPSPTFPAALDHGNRSVALMPALSNVRVIHDLSAVPYPKSVKAPNFELNIAVTPGKFRYDREFMMQFMNVCKGRPQSLAPVGIFGLEPGQGDANKPTGPRGGARRRVGTIDLGSTPSHEVSVGLGIGPGNHATGGGFAMVNLQSRSLRTDSQSRFQTSNKAHGGATSLAGTAGSRMPPMTRGASQGGVDGGGPREAKRTRNQRGDNRGEGGMRGSGFPTSSQQLAGVNLKPIAPLAVSESRWVAGSTRCTSQQVKGSQLVEHKVQALLNKLSMDKFDSISDQIIAYANLSEQEMDGSTLMQVTKLIFGHAREDARFSEISARLCRKMIECVSPSVQDQNIRGSDGQPISGGTLFRKYLLNRCQEDFERGWGAKVATVVPKKNGDKPLEPVEERDEESTLYSDEYYAAAKAKRLGLGLIRFMGELFKQRILPERIMHDCIKRLLSNVVNPDEERIQSLCALLTTIGQTLDKPKARNHMDIYFDHMNEMAKSNTIKLRIQFLVQGVIELREKRWQPRHTVLQRQSFTSASDSRPDESPRGAYSDLTEADEWNVSGRARTQLPARTGDPSQFGETVIPSQECAEATWSDTETKIVHRQTSPINSDSTGPPVEIWSNKPIPITPIPSHYRSNDVDAVASRPWQPPGQSGTSTNDPPTDTLTTQNIKKFNVHTLFSTPALIPPNTANPTTSSGDSTPTAWGSAFPQSCQVSRLPPSLTSSSNTGPQVAGSPRIGDVVPLGQPYQISPQQWSPHNCGHLQGYNPYMYWQNQHQHLQHPQHPNQKHYPPQVHFPPAQPINNTQPPQPPASGTPPIKEPRAAPPPTFNPPSPMATQNTHSATQPSDLPPFFNPTAPYIAPGSSIRHPVRIGATSGDPLTFEGQSPTRSKLKTPLAVSHAKHKLVSVWMETIAQKEGQLAKEKEYKEREAREADEQTEREEKEKKDIERKIKEEDRKAREEEARGLMEESERKPLAEEKAEAKAPAAARAETKAERKARRKKGRTPKEEAERKARHEKMSRLKVLVISTKKAKGAEKRETRSKTHDKTLSKAMHKEMPQAGGIPKKVKQPRSRREVAPHRVNETRRARGSQRKPRQVEEGSLVRRKVRALLNKLTAVKFHSISNQIIAYANKSEKERDASTLTQVTKLILDRAKADPEFSGLYAQLCCEMMERVSPYIQSQAICSSDGWPISGGVLFQKCLVERCQEEFERDWSAKTDALTGAAAKADNNGQSALCSNDYHAVAKAKRHALGLIRFIGELFNQHILTPRVIHKCIEALFPNAINPDEMEVEGLRMLLTAVGQTLDISEGYNHMDIYSERIYEMIRGNNVKPRMRFILLDIVELRAQEWQPRHSILQPERVKKDVQNKPVEFLRVKYGYSTGPNRRIDPRGTNNSPVADADDFSQLDSSSVFSEEYPEDQTDLLHVYADRADVFLAKDRAKKFKRAINRYNTNPDGEAYTFFPATNAGSERKKLILSPRIKPIDIQNEEVLDLAYLH